MQDLQRQFRTIADWQRHLLPRDLPQPPGWRWAAHYSVAPRPGGDYYDFLTLPDGRMLLMVADASGHGGPSAVLVAIVRVMLHSCPLSSGQERLPFCPILGSVIQPPHVTLGHLNRILFENSLEDQFMTAFCGVLSPAEGTLHYAIAGHPLPRWWRMSRQAVEPIRDIAGLPLGIQQHADYYQARMGIEPGDTLVIFTDGLIEAENDRGEPFGYERLQEALQDFAPHGAEAVKSGTLARLETFLNGREPHDDVTMVVVERRY